MWWSATTSISSKRSGHCFVAASARPLIKQASNDRKSYLILLLLFGAVASQQSGTPCRTRAASRFVRDQWSLPPPWPRASENDRPAKAWVNFVRGGDPAHWHVWPGRYLSSGHYFDRSGYSEADAATAIRDRLTYLPTRPSRSKRGARARTE